MWMHIVQSLVIQDCPWGVSLEELKLREQFGHKRENFVLPILIKAVCWCQIQMLLFRFPLRLVIDFSTMKEKNSKGSIKGDVCCTRACVWLGLEQCRGWKFWILVPCAGSEKHRWELKVSGWLWWDTNSRKMFKEKYPKATLIYLCSACTNRNCSACYIKISTFMSPVPQ